MRKTSSLGLAFAFIFILIAISTIGDNIRSGAFLSKTTLAEMGMKASGYVCPADLRLKIVVDAEDMAGVSFDCIMDGTIIVNTITESFVLSLDITNGMAIWSQKMYGTFPHLACHGSWQYTPLDLTEHHKVSPDTVAESVICESLDTRLRIFWSAVPFEMQTPPILPDSDLLHG